MAIDQKLKGFLSAEWTNSAVLALISTVQALQVCLLLTAFARFFPVPTPPLILSEWSHLYHPVPDVFFYHLFVVLSIGCFVALSIFFRKRFGAEDFFRRACHFLTVDGFLTLIPLTAGLQLAMYGQAAGSAQNLFWIGFGLIGLTKIGWRYWYPAFKKWEEAVQRGEPSRFPGPWLTFVIPVLIFLALFVPDPSGVAAKSYTADNFYHLDGILVGPAWAFLKGSTLNVHQITQYGLGMPIMMALLAKAAGGLTYERIISIMNLVSIAYYFICFFFLRYWLRDVLLASAAVFGLIRLQLFHYGAVPFIWNFPNGTPLRYFFDVVILFCLLAHARTSDRKYLGAAALVCGLSLFYVFDVGVYLFLTFGAYLALLLLAPKLRTGVCRNGRGILIVGASIVAAPMVFLASLWISIGAYFWDPVFWSNSRETFALYGKGFSCISALSMLSENGFYEFWIGMIVLQFYLLTVLIAGRLCFSENGNSENAFITALGVYGLCSYHYFVVRGAATSYYTLSLPLIFLAVYFAGRILTRLSPAMRIKTGSALALLSFFSLLLSHVFMIYPNVCLWKTDPFLQDKQKFAQLSLDEDSALIRRLTSPEEKVCLISSFETLILMKTDRKPFFYYFPILGSKPLDVVNPGSTYLFTRERLQRTIRQLETEKPEHVFIEKNLLAATAVFSQYQHDEAMETLVAYFHEFYAPVEAAKYLVALKRIKS